MSIGHRVRYSLSQVDADDVLQETFLRLARIRHRLAKVNDLDAYVITIARNEAARLATSNARRQRTQKPLATEDLFCYPPSDADAREIAETVATAQSHLCADLREIVELKTYAGLTFQQISQVTGLPQGTVATRYHSALAKMQIKFARQP